MSSPFVSAPPNTVVGEADGWMDLPVTLSAPSANVVTVAYSIPGGICNNPDAGSSGTLTLPSGVVLQAIRVQINNCNVTTNQTFTLTLSGATNATIAQTTTTVTVVHVEGSLTPLTPARILDTRFDVGAVGPVAAGGTISLQVDGAGGVPGLGGGGGVLNVTATQPKTAGNLDRLSRRGGSTEHLEPQLLGRETVPNLVIAPVGATARSTCTTSSGGTIQMLADVSGWFASGAPGCRRFDPADPGPDPRYPDWYGADGSGGRRINGDLSVLGQAGYPP